MTPEEINIAVRVLTHQGHNATADDDIRPHLLKIQDRYRELKRTHDFETSALIARSEWLARFMNPSITARGQEWFYPLHKAPTETVF